MAKSKTKQVKDYTRPGEPLSQEEFVNMVREAEKGPFYPVEILEKDFQEWKKKRKK